MTPLILIGGGGHCRASIDIVEQTPNFSIAGIVDSSNSACARVLGYPIVGGDDELPELIKNNPNTLITVGQIKSSFARVRLFNLVKRLGATCAVVQSHLSYCSRHSVIGEGTILMHYSIVNANSTIGVNCIINSQALIEHDVSIGDHCHVSTGAKINGGARIGAGSFVGSGSVVKQGVCIGKNVTIGAGQTILSNVPDGVIVR